MKITKRSILALTIAALLSACGSDDDSQPGAPAKPQPLKPLPSETINVAVGNADVTATKESLVITTVEGEEKLGSVESFKGITFAQAARFEHSDTANLEGSINATEFGNVCPQIKATVLEQSEDCLNLNIWRPEGAVEGDDLPVYVFIHGGDFEYGSGSNPMIHGDTVVAQGADEGNPFIAVTFNYRLGLLGTKWVEGSTSPKPENSGNYAIGDQKSALEWINNNIKYFGGSKGNVTVIGQGSGAMSIGILQLEDTAAPVSGEYFRRAIMQSNPYGFEYSTYKKAESIAKKLDSTSLELFNKPLAELDLKELKEVQAEFSNPLNRVVSWLTNSLPLVSKGSPMSQLMPFSPYIESKILYPGYHVTQQPVSSSLTVPTVLGVNENESNTMSILPNLTSLIAIICGDCLEGDDSELAAEGLLSWLDNEDNKAQITSRLESLVKQDDFSAQLELQELIDALPSSAYETITKLFFGANNNTGESLLSLTDFIPNNEHSLLGAIENMGQYRTLMNDMLFTGPARMKAAESDNATFYYFKHKPSFNVWTYQNSPNLEDPTKVNIDFGDLLKTISCVTGTCNASELPFVFNKAVKLDGTSVKPNSTDKQLMNEMSRLWFSDKLFNDYQYSTKEEDKVLVIDHGSIEYSDHWDKNENPSKDAGMPDGRLTGLEEKNILLNYINN
ncbi:carboxylesterase family protein [Vibrio pacinii]|uniref:carboxylesterase family protein n=1 Tax=Vibrio pacinii TaxID=170674 RepID=UPI00056FA75D|nr:carboxylesterase family protein [Vibrio pacinii]